MQNIVITYCRPFTSTKDKHGIKHRLGDRFVKGYEDPDHRILHRHLILVRNQSIAHSDAGMRNAGAFQSALARRDSRFDAALVSFGAEPSLSHRMMALVESMIHDLGGRLADEVHRRQSTLLGTRATVSHSVGRHIMVIDAPEMFGEPKPPHDSWQQAFADAEVLPTD